MKENVFLKELEYIKDDRIRNSAKTMLNLLPDYFYKVEAASTGKYHPKYAQGEMGLVRHTKAAVRMATELFGIYKFDDKTKDLIIYALLIHDGLKKGLEEAKYTKFNHPVLIGEYLVSVKDKLNLTDEEVNRIVKMDASHMGKWNTNEYEPNIILPVPKSVEEKFVHMCDYLASRKFINIEFDNNSNILD